MLLDGQISGNGIVNTELPEVVAYRGEERGGGGGGGVADSISVAVYSKGQHRFVAFGCSQAIHILHECFVHVELVHAN